VLPHGLWIVGKTVSGDEGAVVDPEPNTVAGQDQGGSDRVAASSAGWGLGGLRLPAGAAFGPGGVGARSGSN
jgi:hypothetical protein